MSDSGFKGDSGQVDRFDYLKIQFLRLEIREELLRAEERARAERVQQRLGHGGGMEEETDYDWQCRLDQQWQQQRQDRCGLQQNIQQYKQQLQRQYLQPKQPQPQQQQLQQYHQPVQPQSKHPFSFAFSATTCAPPVRRADNLYTKIEKSNTEGMRASTALAKDGMNSADTGVAADNAAAGAAAMARSAEAPSQPPPEGSALRRDANVAIRSEQGSPSRSATMAAGEDPPPTRENASEGVFGRGHSPRPGNRQSPPRSGEATQETSENGVQEQLVGKDSTGGTKDKISILPAPERKPPDERFDGEDTRTPATERSDTPRTASRIMGRARRERGIAGRTRVFGWRPARRARWMRGNGGRARMAGQGSQSRLRRRTTPKRTRVKEKGKEVGSWEMGAEWKHCRY